MTTILWLTPNKPENISIGRQRIASGLRERGYEVTQKAGTLAHLSGSEIGEYDLCIGTTRAGGLFGLGSALGRTPFIVDHVDPISQFYRTANPSVAKLVDYGERVTFWQADGVMYVYDGEQYRVERHNHNTKQTHLGVDYERFANPEKSALERATEILDTQGVEPGFAVYIGGLEPLYNIERMLIAALTSDRDFVIAGAGSQQALVEAFAQNDDSIHYFGSVQHRIVPGLLKKASVGVSLVDDPHTVKVLEYAASGLPVVQLAGRASEVLPDEAVFTDKNPENISGSIGAAIGLETPALQHYAKQRDWETVVDDYEGMIQNVA